ncbi:acyltransferase [Agromyces sp. H66]|uniref:acyltransferase family protein n=1 Tax=Agromyces sp. H66 TaxID=2529859 RepID=UPI00145A1834|nr:acyltransferase [Agromyces sp. H66]
MSVRPAPADDRVRSAAGLDFRAAMRGRSNALGVLRLVLASAVIVSHAFPLGGWGDDPFFSWSHGQENLGGVAVLGFFAISGYLITKSGVNSGVVPFLWRRVLRIFPAFWAVLLVGILVVGPIAWFAEGRTLDGYASRWPGGPLWYFIGNMTLVINQWGIHDIFVESTPYGQAVGYSVFNGSLWTLAYEFGCYLMIGALVLFGLLRRAPFVVPLLTGVFLVLQGLRFLAPEVFALLPGWFGDPLAVNLSLAFLWGAVIAVYSHRVRVSDVAGVISIAVAAASYATYGFGFVGLPALAYALLWAAVRLPERVKRIGSRNDYSYGIYLYGFLVQQLFASFGWHALGYVPYVLISLAAATAFAMASWHLLEKPALSLKDRGPGRGVAYWVDRARNRERKATLPAAGKESA